MGGCLELPKSRPWRSPAPLDAPCESGVAVCGWRSGEFWLPCPGRANAYRYDVAIVILLVLYGGCVASEQL